MADQSPPAPSADTLAALKITAQIVHAYLASISLTIGDTARDPTFGTTHLLSYLS